jgi:hypothetical protein
MQVAAIAWSKAGQLNRRPVIVGLALQRTKAPATREDDDDFVVSEDDRQTFNEIMLMLMDCLDWTAVQ